MKRLVLVVVACGAVCGSSLLDVSALPSRAQAPLLADDSKPDGVPVFTSSIKSKYANQLRQRSAGQRAPVLRELGDYADVEAARLLVQYGLRDRTPEVQAAAAQTLRKMPVSPPVERFLIDEMKQELAERRKGALEVAGRLARAVADRHTVSATEELVRQIESHEGAARTTVLEALLESIDSAADEPDERLLVVCRTLAATPLYENQQGLRKCVCDAARRIRLPGAVALLIDQLDLTDGQLRFEVIQYLRGISGEGLSHDANAWRRWWSTAGRDFRFPDEKDEQSSAARYARERSPSYYYDMPVHAKRLVFVLDTSKSMGAGGATSRLESAKRELVKAIEQLPEDARFNVILFQSQVYRWNDHLEPASAAAKLHAAAFIRGQKPVGKTATYDALQAAFAIGPEVESIYLLTDGAPSEGSVVARDAILDAIRKQNRTRRLRINTFGAVAGQQSSGFEDFLKRLAADNYGEYRRLQ